jgi:putative DNA primase/helicase
MTALIGPENVANPTLSQLGANFGLAPLIGKLAAIITDARLSGRTDVAQVVERLLAISGEDNQTIDRKHLPAWTGKLTARFTIISNEIPRLTETSGALAGRMIIHRMTRSFYGQEDENLMARLLPELPGILLWAIEGWRRLRERGHFLQPESGRPLVEEMEELCSPVGTFVKELCETGPDREIEVSALFAAWKTWCEEKNRGNVGDEPAFGRNLRTVLPDLITQPIKRGGKYHRVFKGIDLSTAF